MKCSCYKCNEACVVCTVVICSSCRRTGNYAVCLRENMQLFIKLLHYSCSEMTWVAICLRGTEMHKTCLNSFTICRSYHQRGSPGSRHRPGNRTIPPNLPAMQRPIGPPHRHCNHQCLHSFLIIHNSIYSSI